jgi:hypothetical protein
MEVYNKSLSMHRYPTLSLPLDCPTEKFCIHFPFSFMYTTCLAHPICHDLITIIIFDEEYKIVLFLYEKGNGKVHPCTGTEAVYRLCGPQGE